MPLGIPHYIIRSGRRIYKDSRGKTVSKKTYDLLQRQHPGTLRFLSKAEAARRGSWQAQEARLRSQLGRPPRGHVWVRIANKYPDRFAAYL